MNIVYHTRMFANVHVRPVNWTYTNIRNYAYEALKAMLTQAPVVQSPDWSKPFHVFVDASDIAIGSALMQLTKPSWYRPVYYSSRKLSLFDNRARSFGYDLQHQ